MAASSTDAISSVTLSLAFLPLRAPICQLLWAGAPEGQYVAPLLTSEFALDTVTGGR